MSVMTVAGAMDRIRSATERSPIAVFMIRPGATAVNVVFANTVLSLKAQEEPSANLIGVYHKGMCRETVHGEILASIRKEANLERG